MAAIDEFGFESGEEGIGCDIVVPVASPTRGRQKAVGFALGAKLRADGLHAAVEGKHDFRRAAGTVLHGRDPGGDDKIGFPG